MGSKCAALSLLLLNTETESNVTEYVFAQYLKSTLTLNETDAHLGRVCFRYCTADRKDYRAVARVEPNSSRGPDVGGWLGVNSFGAIHTVVNLVRDNCGSPLMSRPLLCAYHLFYINKFYTCDFLKLESIQSDG